MSKEPSSETGMEIAIIGMAGRFPSAPDLNTYWENLRSGIEAISVFPDDELRASGVSEEMLASPDFVKAQPVLENVELFDAQFFGFSPREAQMMDPQQRFFLECAWEALENAGYCPEKYPGAIGVFGGSSLNSYALYNLFKKPDLAKAMDGFRAITLNDKDFL